MTDLRTNVAAFVQLLRSGQTDQAIEDFYHDEVLVFENRTLTRAGKSLCLSYEREQLRAHPTRPQFKFSGQAVNEHTGHAFLEYSVRFTAPNGRPMRLDEVAVQMWSHDKIVQERFYYEGLVDEGDQRDDEQ